MSRAARPSLKGAVPAAQKGGSPGFSAPRVPSGRHPLSTGLVCSLASLSPCPQAQAGGGPHSEDDSVTCWALGERVTRPGWQVDF